MSLRQLEISDFRNIVSSSLLPDESFNLVIGPNASGKTSLLEAMYCLGRGRSFRTRNSDQLIRQGQRGFTVFARIQYPNSESRLGLQRQDGETRIRLDGQDVRVASQLSQRLPIKILEPGLHAFFDQGPEPRRRFLEWGMFHVEPDYAAAWRNYRRLLQQRNAALKGNWPDSSLQRFDEMLAETGEVIAKFRESHLRQSEDAFKVLCTELGLVHFSDLTITGYQGWQQGVSLLEALSVTRESDRQRGFTQTGPHRTDLRVRTNGMTARDFLSRGEQKLLIALLHIAQSKLLYRRTGKRSLLLVDDLSAELDPENRALLADALKASDCQVFITATNRTALAHVAKPAAVFHVEHGKIVQVL